MLVRLALFSAAALAFVGVSACNKSEADNGLLRDAPEAPPAPEAGGQRAETAQAQAFIDAAGQASLAGVETSKLALEHAKSIDAKALAQKLIDDHTAAEEALTAAAHSAGLDAPATTLDEIHLRKVNDLTADRSQGDRNFDADFAALQIEAAKDATALYQDYIRDGDIPAVKAFAEQTLPKLRDQRADAEQLQRQMRSETPAPG